MSADEAREALLEALAGNRDAPVIDRLNDFEAAVDTAARAEAYRQGHESAVYDAEAGLPLRARFELWDGEMLDIAVGVADPDDIGEPRSIYADGVTYLSVRAAVAIEEET